MSLSEKQQRFVDEYLVDLNATAAYKRAGYKATGHAAEVAASRLLRNVEVVEAIQIARVEQSERVNIRADDILREVHLLSHSDIGDILDFSGEEPKLRPANQISEKARRCISGIKVKRYTEGHGDDAREVEVIEFKLWSKPGGLDKLMRHKSLYPAATLNVTGQVRIEIAEEIVEAPHAADSHHQNGQAPSRATSLPPE